MVLSSRRRAFFEILVLFLVIALSGRLHVLILKSSWVAFGMPLEAMWGLFRRPWGAGGVGGKREPGVRKSLVVHWGRHGFKFASKVHPQ